MHEPGAGDEAVDGGFQLWESALVEAGEVDAVPWKRLVRALRGNDGEVKGDGGVLRTLIGEPDIAVGRESEIVDRGELVAKVIVEDGVGLAGAGVESVDTCCEDSIGGGASTGVYQAIVKGGAG